MPVTVITGARQTGKTTLAKALRDRRRYYTLDDVGLRGLASDSPDQLLESLPVTIDEVQRVPGLLLAAKRRVDEGRVAGSIVFTGSANLALMKTVNESLAGRAYYLHLLPFCPSEWNESRMGLEAIDTLFADDSPMRRWPEGPVDWPRWLLRGGYPPALEIEADDDRAIWFAGYLETYLERDLRQLSDVASLPDFQRMMRLLALRCARTLNQSEVARDAGLSVPTAHRYINLLETGYQIVRVANYRANATTALLKAPKLMWTDSGMAAWLAGVNAANLADRPDSGFWLEQLVFQTLQAWKALDPRRQIHFWRDDSTKAEIDFILEDAGRLVALEIKASRNVGPADARWIRSFQQSAHRRGAAPIRGAVLHTGGENRPLGERLHALSLHAFAPG
jgi:predicted AAA+ superfamily ATPase